MPKRKLKGSVVSSHMDKTIIVAVDKFKEHPKYKKRYKSTRRYKVAVSEQHDFKPGDRVVIGETKPQSKDKKWKIVEKITAPKANQESEEKMQREGEEEKQESEEIKEEETKEKTEA